MSADGQAASILNQLEIREVVELTKSLASIPSFPGDEAAAAEYLAGRMRAWGFDDVSLQEAEPGRPNVIGTLHGDGSGIRFMFAGHLDIDPIPEGYDRPLWQSSTEGDHLYGVGVGNMKAGLAAMIMAAVALRRAGMTLKGELTVACLVGGLQGGIGMANMLEKGPPPDAAIVPAPTGLQIRTLHAGVLELLVTLHGRAVWIGQTLKYKWVNAIEKALAATRVLQRMEFTHAPHPEMPGLPCLQVGAIRGGLTREYHLWRPAFVADCCSLLVDVRLHPGMSVAGAVADIRRRLDGIAADDADFCYELELPPAAYQPPWRALARYMPPLELPKNHPLVQIARAFHERVTGEEAAVGAHFPGSYSGAASGLLWERGIPCFDYGPADRSPFSNKVVLSKLERGTKVLALTAADVCTRTRDELAFDQTWRRTTQAYCCNA